MRGVLSVKKGNGVFKHTSSCSTSGKMSFCVISSQILQRTRLREDILGILLPRLLLHRKLYQQLVFALG